MMEDTGLTFRGSRVLYSTTDNKVVFQESHAPSSVLLPIKQKRDIHSGPLNTYLPGVYGRGYT